jgi:hypothetical protein
MQGQIVYVNPVRGFLFLTSSDNSRFEKFYSNYSFINSCEVPLDQIKTGFFARFRPTESKKEGGFRTATNMEIYREDPQLTGGTDALAGGAR